MKPSFDTAQLIWQAPLLVVVGGALLLLLLEAFARGTNRRWLMYLSAFVFALAGITAALVFTRIGPQPLTLFDGMLVADKFGAFFCLLFALAGFLVSLLSGAYLEAHNSSYGEYYPLLLLGASGMMILAMAGDLVTVFLGVETMSFAAYVLTGTLRRSKRSQEAAMKYFITGAFASAILLYGIALVYGATGETNLAALRAAVDAHESGIFLIGEMLLIVALGFKISAVPFHMWAPDAYEGAPTPITAFMAAGVKAAAFAGVLRLFLTGFGGEVLPFGRLGWATIFGILAAATMTLGNIAALRQENVKRLLAYSSIAHAGYLLVGVVSAGITQDPATADVDAARSATLYYLLAYTVTTIGAFGVVAYVGSPSSKGDDSALVDDWAGLASRHPAAALAMTVFLLSLGGIPPTAGFFGKFYVFRAAMEAPGNQNLWLVIVAVANSVVSIYYYLRIVMAMYFREPARDPQPTQSAAITLALVLSALLVLEMGLLPGSWLELTRAATLLGLGPAAPPAP